MTQHFVVYGPSRAGKSTYVIKKIAKTPIVKFNFGYYIDNPDQEILSLTEHSALELTHFTSKDHLSLILDDVNVVRTVNEHQLVEKEMDKIYSLVEQANADSDAPNIDHVYWVGTMQDMVKEITERCLNNIALNPQEDLSVKHQIVTHKNDRPSDMDPFDVYTVTVE